jgi:hypothetical protein
MEAAAATVAAAVTREEGLMAYRLVDEASDLGAPDYPYGERGQTQRDRRISGGRF